MDHKGFFITFEGPEGCGKSTVIKWLIERLKTDGYKVAFTREPGGTENAISEQIRQVLLNPDNNICPETEALLFAASRAQHVNDFIKPQLAEGKIVICDRFLHSSLAYQGIGRDLGLDQIRLINQLAIKDCYPDLVILLDIDPEIGLKRKQGNNLFLDRLDKENLAFHQKVREGYLTLAQMEPEIFIVIDASKTLELVEKEVYQKVKEKIKYGD